MPVDAKDTIYIPLQLGDAVALYNRLCGGCEMTAVQAPARIQRQIELAVQRATSDEGGVGAWEAATAKAAARRATKAKKKATPAKREKKTKARRG